MRATDLFCLIINQARCYSFCVIILVSMNLPSVVMAEDTCFTKFVFKETGANYEMERAVSSFRKSAPMSSLILGNESAVVLDAKGETLTVKPLNFAREFISETTSGAYSQQVSQAQAVVEVPYNPAATEVELRMGSVTKRFVIPSYAKICRGMKCLQEGQSATYSKGSNGRVRECCSGLMRIGTSGTSFVCSACGDGRCAAPESPGTCPKDCSGRKILCTEGELIGDVCTDSKPEVPKGITTRKESSGEHLISWQHAYGAEEYSLYKRNNKGEYELVKVVIDLSQAVTAPQFSIEPQCYKISAQNRFGSSALSEAMQIPIPVPGDANLDGVVNAADMNRVALNWLGTGKSWSDGDFNGDGLVNESDRKILGENWHVHAGSCE